MDTNIDSKQLENSIKAKLEDNKIIEISKIINFLEKIHKLQDQDLIKSIISFLKENFNISNFALLVENVYIHNSFISHKIKNNKIQREEIVIPYTILKKLEEVEYISNNNLNEKEKKLYKEIINNKHKKDIYVFPFQTKQRVIAILYAYFKNKFYKKDKILNIWIKLVTPFIENTLLSKLVEMDRMTKLYDHHSFMKRLDTEINRAKRHQHNLALVMLDIDFFKKLNDKYGHQAGDSILIDLASLLVTEVRQTDIVARYGGEEFALIFPETSIMQAEKVTRKICKKINKVELGYNTTKTKITVSMGISGLYHANASTSSQLILHADKALYKSKQNGRNQITIYS